MTPRLSPAAKTAAPVLGAPLLTLPQVAQHCSCSVRHVRTWLGPDGLPFVRLGRLVRVDPQALAAFLATRRS